MSTACDRSRELIFERLYGELDAARQGELQSHLQTCAACRDEAAALARTRELVRPGASIEPPRGSRARIMAAVARETARSRAAAAQPAAERASKHLTMTDRLGAWVRGRWALPTLATVGVAAGVLLASRVLIDPQRTLQMSRQEKAPAVVTEVPEMASPPATQNTPAQPGSAQPGAAPAAAQPAEEQSPSGEGSGAGQAEQRNMQGNQQGDEQRKPSAGGRAYRRAAAGLDGVTSGAGAAAPARKPAERKPSADLDSAHGGERTTAAPAARSRAFAAPPAGWAAGDKPKHEVEENVGPPPAMAEKKKGKVRADDAEAADEAPRRDSQPAAKRSLAEAPAAAPAAGGSPARQGPTQAPAPIAPAAPAASASAPVAAPASPPARTAKAAPAAEASTAAASPTPRAPDDLVARVDRLYSEGKLAQAATAYRDLLRRFPQDMRGRIWRARLDTLSAQGY